jgi:hypothetical protein
MNLRPAMIHQFSGASYVTLVTECLVSRFQVSATGLGDGPEFSKVQFVINRESVMSSTPDIEILPILDQTGIISLIFGTTIVALNSLKTFAEPTIAKEKDKFTSQLLPKYLATKEEYSRALVWYIASMISILFALSALGPRLFDALPAMTAFKQTAPLGFALILVGFLPNVPWLRELESSVRHFWHERAYIPEAARAIALTLEACNFDFSKYSAVLMSPSMEGIERTDFEMPRESIEYRWARLSCLLYELERRRDADDMQSLDSEMLNSYQKDLDSLTLLRQALERRIANYRKDKAHNPADSQLLQKLKEALRQLYILLACAVRLKANRKTDISAIFRSFGFDFRSSSPPPSPPSSTNADLIIAGLFVMTVSLLGLVFGAVLVAAYFQGRGLWQPSPYFPNDAVQPFMWAGAALVVHGMAIITADWIWRRGWFEVEGRRPQPIAKYIKIGAVCVFSGYVALYVWSILWEPATIGLAKAIAAFALLPGATGAFYAYHLDNVKSTDRPARWKEIGLQSVVTGLCGLISTPVWLALNRNTGNNADFILLVTVFGAVLGGSLAWYLPRAASSRSYNLIAEVEKFRLTMLKEAASKRFGNERGEKWLSDRQPTLDNRTPAEAIANNDLFLRALDLLQQQPLAAAA